MPRPSRPSYEYQSLLTHRILVLSNTLGKGAVRLYAQRYGVQLSEWRLLASLALATASVNGLATLLGTDKGWISRTVAALVKKGLATTVADPSDARRFEVAVTAKGRAIYEHILPAALERQTRLVSVLTRDERRQLDQMLAKLQGQAEWLAEQAAVEEDVAAPRKRAKTGKKA